MKGVSVLAGSAEQTVRPGFFPGTAPRSDDTAATPKPLGPDTSELEPSVYRFILKHSLRQQIVLLVLTLASFPFLYYSLKLPKTIINRAIDGKHFPQSVLGIDFQQVPYLMFLCGIFLALVLINAGFKY